MGARCARAISRVTGANTSEVEPTLSMLRTALLEQPGSDAERHAQARMRQMHDLIDHLMICVFALMPIPLSCAIAFFALRWVVTHPNVVKVGYGWVAFASTVLAFVGLITLPMIIVYTIYM